MACVARTEEKGRTDDARPQICCNHRDKTVVTNNSGLRINLSKGKHANTYRYVGFFCKQTLLAIEFLDCPNGIIPRLCQSPFYQYVFMT